MLKNIFKYSRLLVLSEELKFAFFSLKNVDTYLTTTFLDDKVCCLVSYSKLGQYKLLSVEKELVESYKLVKIPERILVDTRENLLKCIPECKELFDNTGNFRYYKVIPKCIEFDLNGIAINKEALCDKYKELINFHNETKY